MAAPRGPSPTRSGSGEAAVTLTLKGIISPMPTPFAGEGEIDFERLGQLVDRLIEGGVDGLFPLGTTGEFFTLTREERRKVVDVVSERTNGRVPVLAGVCDPAPKNVITYAEDASDAGADAVVATPPYYYTTTEEGLYRHFRMIQESISLPLVLYNIPEWTHNLVPTEVVARLADEKRIVGMKYTEYNFFNLSKFIEAVGSKISVFTGSDAMTWACLEMGGAGAVIGTSNVFPVETSRMFDLETEGKHEEARELQQRLLPAIEAVGMGKFPAGLKEAMRVAGFPVGEVRPPLVPLQAQEKEAVRRLVLRTAGTDREA